MHQGARAEAEEIESDDGANLESEDNHESHACRAMDEKPSGSFVLTGIFIQIARYYQ